MNGLDLLGKTDWTKDFGLGQLLNTVTHDPERGTYYQREKAYMPLYDFLVYVDKPVLPHVLGYFSLPDDTLDFISWVYNKVAYMDAPKRVKENMTIMPYADLYQLFPQRVSLPHGNVQVFRNGRILDGAGKELQAKRK